MLEAVGSSGLTCSLQKPALFQDFYQVQRDKPTATYEGGAKSLSGLM